MACSCRAPRPISDRTTRVRARARTTVCPGLIGHADEPVDAEIEAAAGLTIGTSAAPSARPIGPGQSARGGQAGDLQPFELAPEPAGPVAPALRKQVEQYHQKVMQGISVNKHIREAHMFRNPDLLEKLVQIFGVDQFGTNFAKTIFDPHGLEPALRYKALEEQRSKHAAHKYAERTASGRIDFTPAAVERAPPLAAGVAPAVGAAADASASAGASASGAGTARVRRSKWDTAPPAPGVPAQQPGAPPAPVIARDRAALKRDAADEPVTDALSTGDASAEKRARLGGP